MPPVRIWLNRNYATTVHLVRQLRDNPDGEAVEILVSHPDPLSPVLAVGDAVLSEPDATAPDYADQALALCRAHGVQIFLPVAGQQAVSERRADFAAAGVALICPPAPAVALLADKPETYRRVAAVRPELVPPWRSVSDAAGLDAALADFDGCWNDESPLVVKPARGVGADGVRFLTRSGPDLAQLLGPAGLWCPAADLRSALATAPVVPNLMVMPFLPGPETSVDVLAAAGRTVLAVPRTKVGRQRIVDGPPELIKLAAELVEQFELDGLVNVQFRTFEGRPALLEINSRPAAGLYQTELAGVSLAWDAVRLALGRPVVPVVPVLGAEYVTVDTAARLTTLFSPASSDRVAPSR